MSPARRVLVVLGPWITVAATLAAVITTTAWIGAH